MTVKSIFYNESTKKIFQRNFVIGYVVGPQVERQTSDPEGTYEVNWTFNLWTNNSSNCSIAYRNITNLTSTTQITVIPILIYVRHDVGYSGYSIDFGIMSGFPIKNLNEDLTLTTRVSKQANHGISVRYDALVIIL